MLYIGWRISLFGFLCLNKTIFLIDKINFNQLYIDHFYRWPLAIFPPTSLCRFRRTSEIYWRKINSDGF